MKIIAGKFKGTILFSPDKSKKVRPTASMVREALFCKLQNDLENARVLDLFCGSGALGIEAISRGANEAIFVDNNYKSIQLTKQNLTKLNLQMPVFKADFKIFLNSHERPFDIIFLDPPYAKNYYSLCLKLIYERNLLKKDGIIICEHDAKEEIKTEYFKIFDIKKYGSKKLSFLQ